MSFNDLYVSNGTCYFARGQVADSHFIPCGNGVTNGPQACCYAGDFCLSSSTCWDNDTIVTYVAGCTDVSFSSSKCIQRSDYPDQQWVAMSRCDGPDVNIWSGCAKHPKKIEIEKENCDCTAAKPMINNPNGKTSFDLIASLPTAAGGTISFHPTAIPTRNPTTSSSTGSSQTGPTPTSTTLPPAQQQELSTGTKAGIGVGVGVGAILIGLVLAAAIIIRRRKKKAQPAQSTPVRSPMQQTSPPPTGNAKTEVKADDSGGIWPKPELPADTSSGAELPDNNYMHRTSELSSLHSDGNTGEASLAQTVSAQSTGGSEHASAVARGGSRLSGRRMKPISELQG